MWNGSGSLSNPNWAGDVSSSGGGGGSDVGELYIIPNPATIEENPKIGLEGRNEIDLPTKYKDFAVKNLTAENFNGTVVDISKWAFYPANHDVTANLDVLGNKQYDLSNFRDVTVKNIKAELGGIPATGGIIAADFMVTAPTGEFPTADIGTANISTLNVNGGSTLDGGLTHGTTIGSLPVAGVNTIRLDVLPVGIDMVSATYITMNAGGAANLAAGGAASVAAGGALSLAGGDYIEYNSDEHRFINTSSGNDYTDIYVGNIHPAIGGTAPLRINGDRGVEISNGTSIGSDNITANKLFISQYVDYPAYDIPNTYLQNDIVQYFDKVYRAIYSNYFLPPDQASFYPWITGTTYKHYEFVLEDTAVYRALNDISSSVDAPSTDPTNWELMPVSTPAEVWVVVFNSLLYSSLVFPALAGDTTYKTLIKPANSSTLFISERNTTTDTEVARGEIYDTVFNPVSFNPTATADLDMNGYSIVNAVGVTSTSAVADDITATEYVDTPQIKISQTTGTDATGIMFPPVDPDTSYWNLQKLVGQDGVYIVEKDLVGAIVSSGRIYDSASYPPPPFNPSITTDLNMNNNDIKNVKDLYTNTIRIGSSTSGQINVMDNLIGTSKALIDFNSMNLKGSGASNGLLQIKNASNQIITQLIGYNGTGYSEIIATNGLGINANAGVSIGNTLTTPILTAGTLGGVLTTPLVLTTGINASNNSITGANTIGTDFLASATTGNVRMGADLNMNTYDIINADNISSTGLLTINGPSGIELNASTADVVSKSRVILQSGAAPTMLLLNTSTSDTAEISLNGDTLGLNSVNTLLNTGGVLTVLAATSMTTETVELTTTTSGATNINSDVLNVVSANGVNVDAGAGGLVLSTTQTYNLSGKYGGISATETLSITGTAGLTLNTEGIIQMNASNMVEMNCNQLNVASSDKVDISANGSDLALYALSNVYSSSENLTLTATNLATISGANGITLNSGAGVVDLTADLRLGNSRYSIPDTPNYEWFRRWYDYFSYSNDDGSTWRALAQDWSFFPAEQDLNMNTLNITNVGTINGATTNYPVRSVKQIDTVGVNLLPNTGEVQINQQTISLKPQTQYQINIGYGGLVQNAGSGTVNNTWYWVVRLHGGTTPLSTTNMFASPSVFNFTQIGGGNTTTFMTTTQTTYTLRWYVRNQQPAGGFSLTIPNMSVSVIEIQ